MTGLSLIFYIRLFLQKIITKDVGRFSLYLIRHLRSRLLEPYCYFEFEINYKSLHSKNFACNVILCSFRNTIFTRLKKSYDKLSLNIFKP